MLQRLQRLVGARDQRGASAVEYGLLVAAIAAVIVIIVFALGHLVRDSLKSTCDSISGQNAANGGNASACNE
jgi:pilus assembly protein Flp/PilA